MKYSSKQLKEQLNQHNFNIKKRFGQNFIIEQNIIKKIVEKSLVNKESLVIEIGPGSGSLTYELCKKAGFVICYEIDQSLSPILGVNLKDYSNYKIIYGDFLKQKVKIENNYKEVVLVANLPYYISTPIITKIIKEQIKINRLYIMIQKEVAERFMAQPNTKSYNSLSIFLSYYYDISKVMDISRNAFLPKPNVDSVVICMKRTKQQPVANEELFFQLIRDSFRYKRKTLKNNLKNYNLNIISQTLKKYNYDLNVRAEQLNMNIYIEIVNNLSK